jgi:tol-pal system protein YbgF
VSANPAHAGLFDDDEARKAILDLRRKVDAINEQLNAKTDKKVILDQLNQLGTLQEDIAKIRGQVEVLTNDVSELQRQQKEFYADLDNRLSKLEPKKVQVDGKEAQVEQSEQKTYDAAVVKFQSGDYAGAAYALQTFIKTYPHSPYVPNAQYSLGIAYYAQKNYKNAIATFSALIKAHPDNAKAPDAMLNIASCYTEQKDNANAKKMLQRLRTEYPDSAAAKTAIDRLTVLK